jgi:hypothetical protein
MLAPIIIMDLWMAAWLPAFACVVVWALVSAVLSMLLYATLSPQHRILSLKAEQKTLRHTLLNYDGPFDSMMPLIRQNLLVSFRLIGICMIPVLVATIPIVWIMMALYERYGEQPFLTIGPEWMHGFDILYLITLIIASLLIKYIGKIA